MIDLYKKHLDSSKSVDKPNIITFYLFTGTTPFTLLRNSQISSFFAVKIYVFYAFFFTGQRSKRTEIMAEKNLNNMDE